MTAANWSGDTAPQPGEDLDFPVGATNLSAVNDFPAGTSFGSITIGAPRYALSGNPVNLTGVMSTSYSSGTSSNAIATDLGGGIVTVVAGGELDLYGVISGPAGLGVLGGGKLVLKAANTYPGTTTITGTGTTLLVDGATGAVQVNSGAMLGGVGTVGAVTSTGGIISPGDAPGVLKTGSLTLDSNSTFAAELDGTAPGNGTTGFDQVVASGPVDLGGATLSATIGGGYIPTSGDQLTIIQNNSGSPITATFANLLEGGEVNISGSGFRITYLGGAAGDSVVLTAVTTGTTTTLTSSTNPAVVGQSVTFTALVAPVSTGAGTPTGTVIFLANGTPIGTAAINPATGLASITTATLGIGRTSVTAVFSSSNSLLQSSQSSPLTQTVSTAGTQSIVTAEAVRNGRGQFTAVKLVAQILAIAPGSGVPTGTVTYFLNGNRFKTKSLSNGKAVVSVKPIRAVGMFLYIQFSGDTQFLASVSRSQIINKRTLKTSARPLTAFPARRHARG
jgi:hypothetical protein